MSLLADYLLQSLGFSLIGFIVGYVLGELGPALCGWGEIGETVSQYPPRHPPLAIVARYVAGIAILLLVVITMVIAVSANARLQGTIACQAQFNTTYRDALVERNEATDQERQAQRTLLLTFVARNPSSTPQQQETAIQNYLAVLAQSDQKRAANPLPSMNTCGR